MPPSEDELRKVQREVFHDASLAVVEVVHSSDVDDEDGSLFDAPGYELEVQTSCD